MARGLPGAGFQGVVCKDGPGPRRPSCPGGSEETRGPFLTQAAPPPGSLSRLRAADPSLTDFLIPSVGTAGRWASPASPRGRSQSLSVQGLRGEVGEGVASTHLEENRCTLARLPAKSAGHSLRPPARLERAPDGRWAELRSSCQALSCPDAERLFSSFKIEERKCRRVKMKP